MPLCGKHARARVRGINNVDGLLNMLVSVVMEYARSD